jgi:threonyl-tRNA synthetase
MALKDHSPDEILFRKRHSLAHVMAEAVVDLVPGTKVAIGPPVDNGFYYDFDLPRQLKDEDLKEIEKRMKKILGSKSPFERKVLSKEEALEYFKDEPYKVELIQDLPEGEEISTFTSNTFVDLCRGPHVDHMGQIDPKSFKLAKLAGAYWRGDEKRPMLQRIYAYAFANAQELNDYLQFLREAEKRDHRKLGRDLDLFHMEDDNPGQIFWHHKGWTVYRTIQEYIRQKTLENGYQEVKTPAVMPKNLWERSGHWAKYKENMFVTESEKREFALKPMNCPGHVEIFKKGLKSYRDLPLRMAEFGSCTRNEPSGALHGIMRVRGFVQDDAHIFCTEEQVAQEVKDFVTLLKEVYKRFGFEDDKIIVKFSTRPEVRVGDDATWDRAEAALRGACELAGLETILAPGEGAFYGPKLEFTLVDALGREWQCGTIQVDYQLPSKERLDAEYVGADNEKHVPVILHRAILGSLERFIGILIEHYSGALPAWLSPTQAVIIPVMEGVHDYAKEVRKKLFSQGFRVEADLGDDRMNHKIRKHQKQKVPFQLILGGQEMEDQSVSVRLRSGEQVNGLPLEDFPLWLAGKIEEDMA